MRVPIGVIGIIYEARPNVTADAGGLCLRAGNAVILRGGSESFHSSRAIAASLQARHREAGLPEDAVQLVPTRDRAAVGMMLRMPDLIDIIVPRGGKIADRARAAREPRAGDRASRRHLPRLCRSRRRSRRWRGRIVINAKMRRTGVCGAAETLLVDRAVADTHLPPILAELHEAGCEVRGDDDGARARSRARKPATEQDWYTEYLDAILAVRVVDGVDGAIAHINRYGSQHTDAIVTEDAAAAERFLDEVDSAIVLHNASTQFADGGEFGMGAEIGISHRPPAAARAGRRRAAHHLQIRRARQRPGAALSALSRSRLGCRRARVGLLGGSFNPAHDGHRHISLEALKRLGLDEVWWLVSPQNPLKPGDGMAPFADAPRRAPRARRAHPAHPRRAISKRGSARATPSTRSRRSSAPVPAHALRLADGRRQSAPDPSLAALARRFSAACRLRCSLALPIVAPRWPSWPRSAFARRRVSPGAARRLADMTPPAWAFLRRSKLDPRSGDRSAAARQNKKVRHPAL